MFNVSVLAPPGKKKLDPAFAGMVVEGGVQGVNGKLLQTYMPIFVLLFNHIEYILNSSKFDFFPQNRKFVEKKYILLNF